MNSLTAVPAKAAQGITPSPAPSIDPRPYPSPTTAVWATLAILAGVMGFVAGGLALLSWHLGITVDAVAQWQLADRYLYILAQVLALAVLFRLVRNHGGARALAIAPLHPAGAIVAAAVAIAVICAELWMMGALTLSPWQVSVSGGPNEMLYTDRWWVKVLAITILAPVLEELLFRGFLFRALAVSRAGPVGAAIASSVLWTVMHVDKSVLMLAATLLQGLLLCAVVHRMRNVGYGIVAHMANNGAGALLILLGR